jgi:hypothetical protein
LFFFLFGVVFFDFGLKFSLYFNFIMLSYMVGLRLRLRLRLRLVFWLRL